ncbi:hypothetical protein MLD38_002376 [Melastoma candidum]|uniref:Uncharacterized protein n=1 Tax=Melastoma candidum TaxID=119954 RepID=A0ACB9S136_9MYRT|nr:hypothetical protein MLD38_002376 [Melastoma candidum]
MLVDASGVKPTNTTMQWPPGLAYNGRSKEAIELLEAMEYHGVNPNAVTFSSLLSACCHTGLVEEGIHLFRTMETKFGVIPQIQHYGCVVDLLGRAGYLEAAYDFVKSMPAEPDAILWRSLLSACNLHGDLKMAEKVDVVCKLFQATIPSKWCEIQATIPSTPENPSKKPMWRGVIVAYITVALCYFPVALIGYIIFGNAVDDNILITLQKPAWLISAANLFVVVHVIGSYQIYTMPVFDMIEPVLLKKLKFTPSFKLRFIARTTYVVFTMLMAICIPFFRSLLGFFGGFRTCAYNLLPPLHHVALPLQAEKVQLILVHQLDLHHFGSSPCGFGTNGGGLRQIILLLKNY